jgi:hypothetical protein
MLGWFVDHPFANDDIAFGWEKNEGKLKFRIKKRPPTIWDQQTAFCYDFLN